MSPVYYSLIVCLVSWMHVHCSALDECVDSDVYKFRGAHCDKLAELGACNRFPFVRKRCRMSCGLCPTTTTITTAAPAPEPAQPTNATTVDQSSSEDANTSVEHLASAEGNNTNLEKNNASQEVHPSSSELHQDNIDNMDAHNSTEEDVPVDRDLYSPREAYISRVTRQNAHVRACCEAEGMERHCSVTCDFRTTANHLVAAGLDCVGHLDTLVYCVASGNDNKDCCKLYGVPPLCHKLCSSTFNGPIDATLLMCLPYTGTVLACHQVRYPLK